ncbi:MAG: leucine-rich repeat domain-containing protein [Promethearchaeota archaeon]
MIATRQAIFCGDDSADVEMEIVETCNIDLDDYFQDKRVLTREKFHQNFKEILDFIEGWSPSFPEYNNIAWYVLGAFILKLGASLPGEVKERIVASTNWRIDRTIQWPENWIEQRKFYLKDLREKIINHKTGVRTYLYSLVTLDDKDLNKFCIGINNLKEMYKTDMRRKIEHIYLISANLFSFPEEIFDFTNLKILSLKGNHIQSIPANLISLRSLEYLFLEHNNIKTIPEFIMEMDKMKAIDLSYNSITEIPSFLKKGTKPKIEISLYYNEIKDFPQHLKPYIEQ